MKPIVLIFLFLGLFSCGADSNTADNRKILVAPKILSNFRGAIIASIPNNSSFASGAFYHYQFSEGMLIEESTMVLKDPLVKNMGDQVFLIERGAARQQIYQAPLADLVAGKNLNLQVSGQELSDLSGGDPWEILPFSNESVLYLNANGGSIQKRSLTGQIEADYAANKFGVNSLRTVSGLQLGNSGRYILVSQGFSNNEIPVLNNSQALIDLTLGEDGTIVGAPQILPIELAVPQNLISENENTFALFGLCTDEEQSCKAGQYLFEKNAHSVLEKKAVIPFGNKFLQYGGSAASDTSFIAQSKDADSEAIQLSIFSSEEPAGSVLYNFKSKHITNVLYDHSSDIVMFGDEKDGEAVLVVFDLSSREVLSEIVVNGLPYSLAIYE